MVHFRFRSAPLGCHLAIRRRRAESAFSADSARRANLAIRRRRAESAFSADSARRANLAVSGVGAPVEIFDGGDLMKNHDFHKGKMVAVRCFSNTF